MRGVSRTWLYRTIITILYYTHIVGSTLNTYACIPTILLSDPQWNSSYILMTIKLYSALVKRQRNGMYTCLIILWTGKKTSAYGPRSAVTSLPKLPPIGTSTGNQSTGLVRTEGYVPSRIRTQDTALVRTKIDQYNKEDMCKRRDLGRFTYNLCHNGLVNFDFTVIGIIK